MTDVFTTHVSATGVSATGVLVEVRVVDAHASEIMSDAMKRPLPLPGSCRPPRGDLGGLTFVWPTAVGPPAWAHLQAQPPSTRKPGPAHFPQGSLVPLGACLAPEACAVMTRCLGLPLTSALTSPLPPDLSAGVQPL